METFPSELCKKGTMKNSQYHLAISKLIKLLGGKNNIVSGIHCVSRLRLVIKNIDKIDDQRIRELDFTRGTMKLPNSQYHIIIGTDVPQYFHELNKALNLTDKHENPHQINQTVKSTNWLQRLMQHFSDIFIPIIPVLVASGLILAVRNILETDFGGGSLVSRFLFVKGLNDFLWIPAQAGLWFLPVYIVWSIFKKMHGTPVLGILIGLTLLLPPLINIYDFTSAEAQDNTIRWIWQLDLDKFGFDFGSFKFPWKIAYTAQVIPAIGVGFVGIYLERGLKKITPTVLHQIIVPLFTVLGAYTIGMTIIGPIGLTVGTAISIAIKWGLTHHIARYIFAPLFGLFYAPLVVTGLHHMTNVVMIQNANLIGGTILFPILALSNIAQGVGALTFGLIHRQKTKTKQISISATTSAWLGVTEPAMYGVNLRYMAPFIGAIIGSSVGALLLVLSGVAATNIGNGGFLAILMIQPQSKIAGYTTWAGTGYLWFALAMVLTILISSITTIICRKIPRIKKIEQKIGIL